MLAREVSSAHTCGGIQDELAEVYGGLQRGGVAGVIFRIWE